jgi:2-octaprenylphenol hydroxylase
MKTNYDIIVVGAGTAGLCTAALLASGRAGTRFRVHVLDAGREPALDAGSDIALRVSAISLGSMRTLQAAGAWQYIEDTRAFPYRDMRIWDASSVVESNSTLHFSAAEYGLPELGCIVENSLIQVALLRRLHDLGVTVEFNTAIAGEVRAGGTTTLQSEDDREWSADLVIAADGAGSPMRRRASIAVSSWSYPQQAFVTHMRCALPHQDTAWQRFLAHGPIALLPLDEHRVSIVWSTTADRAEAALEASDRDLGNTLSRVSDYVLGELTVAGPRGSFPLRAQYAKEYVREGLALIGDAAHCVHPLAGQGANLGFADAAELAEVLAQAVTAGEHPGDLPVLRRYERARKGANAVMLHFIDGLNRLFLSKIPVIKEIRTTGMRLFNGSELIKRRAAKTALGIDRI